MGFNMGKDLFEAAHHKLALGIDLPQLLHHRKNVLLQRHLVVSVRQQYLFCERRFFQHFKIAVEPFTQPSFVLR
ncbi:hypothetical protein D3C80_2169680 [compost metagenome]